MRESSAGKERLTCSEVSLLLDKKITEEALSTSEQQGLEEHLNDCRKCRDLVSWVSALPGYADELSNEETRSAFQRMTENRSRQKQTVHRRKIAMAIVAAVAVFVAVVVDDGWMRSLFSKNKDDAKGIPACVPVPPTEPVPGVFMTYCKGGEPGTLIGNNGEVRVSLREGTVGMLVDPERPNKRKVAVKTPQGEVRVKGTLFTVQMVEKQLWVEVFRGVVELIPLAKDKEMFDVTADHRANLNRGIIVALTEPRTESLRRVLEAKIARHYSEEQAPVSEETRAAKTTKTASGPIGIVTHKPTETGRPKKADPMVSRGLTALKRGIDAKDDTKEEESLEAEAEPENAIPSIDTLIQHAQSCLIDHDWRCASSRYQEVLKYYPGSPESTAVLISLAKIELRHLNKPNKALEHYKTYQRQAPNGPMAEEALFGVARSYRRLDNKDSEKETLRLFIARYPQSSQIERARVRLSELVKD